MTIRLMQTVHDSSKPSEQERSIDAGLVQFLSCGHSIRCRMCVCGFVVDCGGDRDAEELAHVLWEMEPAG